MKSNGIRLAYIIAVAYAFLGSFLFLRGLDNAGVLGADAVVQVSGDQTVPSAEVVNTVRHIADEHRAIIGRTIDDVREPGTRRHLYLVGSDPHARAAHWLTDGYPAFSADTQTDVHALQELASTDTRGNYIVFGSEDATQALVDRLRGLGFEVRSRAYYEPGSVIRWLGDQPLGLSLPVAALLVALLIAASVIAGVKNYAVQRLHGASYWHLLGHDIRWVARFSSGVLALALAGCVITLGVYNRFSQWQAFAAVVGCVLAGLIGIAILTHAISLVIVQGMPILESLKGRIPAGWAMAGVYMVRLPAVALAVGSVILASLAVDQFRAYQASRDAWRTAADTVYVNFNPSMSADETDAMSIKAGQWLTAAESEQKMILAHQERFERLTGGPAADVLLVNDNYLRAQDVRNARGERIQAAAGAHLLVVIPAGLAFQEDQIIQATQDWVSSMSGDGSPVPVEAVHGEPGQRIFTYGNPVVHDQKALLAEPILLVINASTEVFDADTYTAFASQGGIVLSDMNWALGSAEAHGVSSFIIAFKPTAQEAASMHSELVRDLRIHAFNVLAALGVLLATAIGLAEIYTRKNAQRTFAMFISGWRFTQSHIVVLGGELLLGVVIVGWSVVQTLPLLLASEADATAPPSATEVFLLGGWQPVILTGLAAANFVFFLLALHRKTRQLILTRSPEAQA